MTPDSTLMLFTGFVVPAADESYDGMGPGLTLTLPHIPHQTPAVIEEEIRVN